MTRRACRAAGLRVRSSVSDDGEHRAQNALLCVPQLMSLAGRPAAPNGGSASVLPDLRHHSA